MKDGNEQYLDLPFFWFKTIHKYYFDKLIFSYVLITAYPCFHHIHQTHSNLNHQVKAAWHISTFMKSSSFISIPIRIFSRRLKLTPSFFYPSITDSTPNIWDPILVFVEYRSLVGSICEEYGWPDCMLREGGQLWWSWDGITLVTLELGMS